MGMVELNKKVTISWRDGNNYKISANTPTGVPDKIIDYIITSPYYTNSVLSFTKTEVLPTVPTPIEEPNVEIVETPEILETPKADETIVDTIAEIVSDETNIVEEIDNNSEIEEENIEKKQLNVLKKLLDKSKKNKKSVKAKTTGKKRGRPAKVSKK